MSTTDIEKKMKRKHVCSAIYGVISTLIIEAIILYIECKVFLGTDFEVWMWPIIWFGHNILFFVFDQICYPTKSQEQYFWAMCIVLIWIGVVLAMPVLLSFIVAPLTNDLCIVWCSHFGWGMVLLISHYILERKEINKKATAKSGKGNVNSNVQPATGEYWGRTMRIKMLVLVILTLVTLLLQLIHYYWDAYLYTYIPTPYY